MSTLEVPIDVLAEFFHRVHSDETVADTIDCFHKEHGCNHCNNCGGPATDCCANCKTMRYCSSKCLEEDWLHGGHQNECKAIRERLPWKSLAHEVMTDTVPSDESITGRHLVRLMGAFDAAAQIAGKGGPSGGGGGHMPSMGGRGSMSRPRPSAAHYGHSRGYGYHRYHTGYRGHGGLAYNGRPMGYWGGWAFPWIMMGSFWYPYWFFLNGAALAAFYEAQRTQAQFMYGGVNYGVPPPGASPGQWGPVPRPGSDGYPITGGGGSGYYNPPMGVQTAVDENEVRIESSMTDADLFSSFHDSIQASVKDVARIGWPITGPKTRYDLAYASWMCKPGKTIRRSHHTVEGLWVTHAFLIIEHARALKEKDAANIEASDKARKNHLEHWKNLLGDEVRLAVSNLMSFENIALMALIRSVNAQQDEGSRSVIENMCNNLAVVFAPLMNPRFEAAGRNEFRQEELSDAIEVTRVRLGAMFRTYASKFHELALVTSLKGPDSEGFYWAAWSLIEECKGQGMRLRYYIRKDALLLKDRIEEAIEDRHLDALQGELIGSKGGHWIQKAIKHPGRLTQAANRADHGHYKGHTMAFARHVVHGHGKHEHKGLKKAANLAITLSKMNHHHGK